MNRIIEVGNFNHTGAWKSPQGGRVYWGNGLCPTLTCYSTGGYVPPKVLIRADEIGSCNSPKIMVYEEDTDK